MSNTLELKIKIDKDLKKRIEIQAFNQHMSVVDYVNSKLEASDNFFIPPGAKVVETITGYRYIHKVDGKILFKESGADAIGAVAHMDIVKPDPSASAAYLGESLAAILEAVHYFESGAVDYAKYVG